ncbi:AAA family ATPase [endosymbiont GvMRE of Glomus versiforme]|uniref:AAA family ATPase n=1 Tax=endosymbiont GvMRE of Glomus versiforme TaxID=2039283 RepID=UPI000EBAB68C|nr:ATP-binding protein [endosymbiont GvMRE of Glomus versiforme]RHZ37505.1 26S proteasome regulatory subunit 4 [endosymbiont GvMRE of Glomus versiforme]
MNLNEQINKIKLALFGNVWIVRLVKLLRYLSIILVGWLISKSQYLFPGTSTPWSTFKLSVLRWEERKFEELMSGFFVFVFFAFLVFVYFLLSGMLVEWLVRINLSPHQQVQIIEKKTYVLNEKTNYSVKKIDNLESSVFWGGSPHYVSLKGTLLLSDGKNKKTINFVCRSHSSIINPYFSPNNLETYFPQTNIKFKQKSFITWKLIVFIILFLGAGTYILRNYWDIKQNPEQMAGRVVKSKQDIQEELAKQQKEKTNEELKIARRKEAKITAPEEIKHGFEYIGGLENAVRESRANAEAIRERNANPNSLVEPQHMLFYGPPGTGKTFLAQSIAKASDSFFLNLNGSDFEVSLAEAFGNTSGPKTSDRMTKIFDIALQEAGNKTIVALIDEIDHMQSFEGSSKEIATFLGILSGTTSEKYKRIKVIATTNRIWNLDPALLRSERISTKMLINYPTPDELKKITRKVLERFYEENATKEGGAKAFGNLGQGVFVNKFIEPFYKILLREDFTLTYEQILEGRGIGLPSSGTIKPEDRRTLFTGADISQILLRSLGIMKRRGSQTLTTDHILQATKDIFKFNQSDIRWRNIVQGFIYFEIEKELTEEDRRKYRESMMGGGGPGGPKQ